MERPTSFAMGSSLATAVNTSLFIQREIMLAPPFLSVARVPAGGFFPGLYLPVNAPCAIGDQTMWPIPSLPQSGST